MCAGTRDKLVATVEGHHEELYHFPEVSTLGLRKAQILGLFPTYALTGALPSASFQAI